MAQTRPYQGSDRRPIASRDYAISKYLTKALVRIGLSANAISTISVLFACAAGASLAWTGQSDGLKAPYFVVAAVMILGRLLANMLDGMVALESGTASPVGELYNEIPCRISDTIILVGTGYAMGGWIIMGYAAAIAAMLTAYVRAIGKAAGARQDFCGPMAKQQRMFTLILASIWSAFAPESLIPLGGALGLVLALITILSIVTAIRRITRIATQLKGAAT